ncbi:MAG TPA: BON domain-containing protein [Terriglobales bacterium]
MRIGYPRLGIVAIVAVLAALAGCNKATVRTDAQVAAEVQSKINSDSGISSRDVGIQSANGVVTLSGNVGSEVERVAAAGDAATVEGVKTVVNNLVVQQARATSPSAIEPPAASTVSPSLGKKAPKSPSSGRVEAMTRGAGALPAADVDASDGQPNNLPPAPPESAPAQAPAPPPPPKKLTIPAGTQLTVRLNDTLDSERNQVGDSFHATLGVPIVIDDETVIPSGADVAGHVVDVKSAGRFAGNSVLKLELTSISVSGKTYNVQTSQWSRQGKGEGKNTAVKAGGGAAIGAVIGGLAGGGKGAAIGSVAGAGAGTGAAATKKGEQIKLAPESTLSFLLINTLTVTQQNSNHGNINRTPLQ